MKFKTIADKQYSKFIKREDGIYIERKIYPVLNEDGSIKWFNLLTGGSYVKIFLVIMFVIIMLGFIFEYHSNFTTCVNAINKLNVQTISNIKISNQFNNTYGHAFDNLSGVFRGVNNNT